MLGNVKWLTDDEGAKKVGVNLVNILEKSGLGGDKKGRILSSILSAVIGERETKDYGGDMNKDLFTNRGEDATGVYDHGSVVIEGGEKVMMLEPYKQGMENFEKLVEFCKKNGYDFIVSGESSYFPGRTFVIKLYKKA